MVHPGQSPRHGRNDFPGDRGAGSRHFEGRDPFAALLPDQHEFVVDADRRAGHVGHVGHHRVHRHRPDQGDPDATDQRLGPVRAGPRPAVAIAHGQRRDPARTSRGEARPVADPAARRQVDDPDRAGVEREDRLEAGGQGAAGRIGGQVVGRQAVQGEPDSDPVQEWSGPGQQAAAGGQVPARGAGAPRRRAPRHRGRRRPPGGGPPGGRSGSGRPAPGGGTRSRPVERPGRPRSGPRSAGASAGSMPARPRPVSSSRWSSSWCGARRRPPVRAAPARRPRSRPGSAPAGPGRRRSARSAGGRPRRRAPAGSGRGRGSAARGPPRAARPPRRRWPPRGRRAAPDPPRAPGRSASRRGRRHRP